MAVISSEGRNDGQYLTDWELKMICEALHHSIYEGYEPIPELTRTLIEKLESYIQEA